MAVPPVRSLDVFGPAEVFCDANRFRGGDSAYAVEIVSAGEEMTITSYGGTRLVADCTYSECEGEADTLLVAGGVGAREMQYAPAFLEWLKQQCARVRRFGSICTGAMVLAEAGLLDGRRVTTHWKWAGDLAGNYPLVKVDSEPIFIRDGNCYTSAGVTAGIDLTLAMVEEDLGGALALQIAQMMVVFLRRPGGQAQFSATLAAQTHESRPLNDLLAWIADHFREDLPVSTLARRAAMSSRNFARVFAQQVGKSPARHIEDVRLEAARRELESTASGVEEIAEATGFRSAEVLRRAFLRRLGVSPGQYRSSFGVVRTRE